MKHNVTCLSVTDPIAASMTAVKPTMKFLVAAGYSRPPLWRASLPGRAPIEFRAWDDECIQEAIELFARVA